MCGLVLGKIEESTDKKLLFYRTFNGEPYFESEKATLQYTEAPFLLQKASVLSCPFNDSIVC